MPDLTLTLYNTLTRTREAFAPLDPGHVRLYVCGPTVYAYAHIGNARPVVVFDVLYRLLRRLYPRVTYVRNITDIDDKILDEARRTGEPIASITARTTEAYQRDMAALGALAPDVEPRATQHIPEMIALIERLIARGHAYAAEGHVLFSVPSMPDYGRLSGKDRYELIAGARVDVAPYKQDPADFVLWKPSAPDQPGWDSPWGRGRPGWHIECSAMAAAHLGETFDLHGGGQDLIFPHHENEIAQSRCAHGTPFMARVWLHNGYLTVDAEKMSKSLGNVVTVHALLESYPGEAIRHALLSAHYRQPLDFGEATLRQSKAALDRLYGALRGTAVDELDESDLPDVADPVLAALRQDLNTPEALTLLHGEANAIHKETDPAVRRTLQKSLRRSAAVLGLLQQDPEAWFKGGAEALGLSEAEIERLIAQRQEARRARRFDEADRLRRELSDQGVVLEDGPQGTVWRRD